MATKTSDKPVAVSKEAVPVAVTPVAAQGQPVQAASELLSLPQMNIKLCKCDPKEAIRQKKQVFLCRLFGEATSAKGKENRKTGVPYVYFIGVFRAINAKGDTFESEKLFLPTAFQEQLEASLANSSGAVQFGYDFFAVPDDNVTSGYRYAGRSIIKSESSDRLAQLAQTLSDKPMPGSMTLPPAA